METESIIIDEGLTVAKLIEILQQLPPNALVRRQITSELGKTEVEEIRVENSKIVVID